MNRRVNPYFYGDYGREEQIRDLMATKGLSRPQALKELDLRSDYYGSPYRYRDGRYNSRLGPYGGLYGDYYRDGLYPYDRYNGLYDRDYLYPDLYSDLLVNP